MAAPLNGKKIFGAGRPFAVANVANPTPIRFGLPQDMGLTFKRDVKEIMGENQLAADISSGGLSITGKITYGTSQARLFGDLFFGVGSNNSNQLQEADNELGTVGASNHITVVNGATFFQNLGVINTVTGRKMVRVAAAAEIAGKSYSLNDTTGVYTFAVGDLGTVMKLSYLWTDVTQGETVVLTNNPMGRVGGFTSALVFPWTTVDGVAEQDVAVLNSCLATDGDLSTKSADYGKPTFQFSVGCDANDQVGTLTFAQVG